MKVPISDIVHLPEVDVREFIRPDAVERYSEILDSLPPISLVRLLDKRLVLTDGRHRVAAAERISRKGIEADVKDGTLADAIVAAATANAKHGVPFSKEEQRRAVLHLWESDQSKAGRNHPRQWHADSIAIAVGASKTTVQHWLKAERGRRDLALHSAGATQNLTDAHIEALQGVPAPIRPQVAEAAVQHQWQRDDIRKVAKALADPSVRDEDKREVLASITQPGENGEATVGADLIAAVLRESKAFSAKPQIRAFVGAAYSLIDHLKRDPDASKGMSGPELRKLVDDLEVAQEAVDRLRTLVGVREVVA